jgi:hypothetical protein
LFWAARPPLSYFPLDRTRSSEDRKIAHETVFFLLL